MSGAAGHLLHLHENRQLTFAELKQVLTRAAQGNLQEVTEKFDGMNVVFTWNGEIRIARNSSDIKTGGMDGTELTSRFQGRGPVATAFQQAYKVLHQAIGMLSSSEKLKLFLNGRNQVWYSVEVIYPTGASTINYDSNCIVFHGHPIFEHIPETGTTLDISERNVTWNGMEVLKSRIDSMQQAINVRGWRLLGPAIVQLRNLTGGNVLSVALDRIDEVMATANVTDNQTIEDYLYAMSVDRAKAMGISDPIARQVGLRLINKRGAPNVTRLASMSPGHAQQITRLVAQDKKLLTDFIRPIELAISDLACEVLRGMHSVLINDTEGEINRIRDTVNDAIDNIRDSGDIDQIAALERHLNKMRTADNITSTIEGIVFIFKGQAYKLTGAWAPAHQIISLMAKHRR